MYRDMTRGGITRSLLLFALPMMAGSLLQQLYNVADTLIVGRALGRDALAAVGSAFTLMTFLTSIFLGLAMGAGALFAICIGRGDMASLRRAAALALCLIGAVTAVLTGLVYALLSPILRFLQVPEVLLNDMGGYLRIIFAGLAATFLYNYFACLLRAAGNSAAPLWFLGGAALLNVGLDPLLIFRLNMGVAGAALATILSQLASFCMLLLGCARGGNLRIRLKNLCFRRDLFVEIGKGGLPSLCRQGLASIATICLNRSAGLYGDAAIAAMSVVSRAMMLAQSALIGFGQGFQPVCGFNYGAGLYHRVKEGFRFCVKWSTVFLTAVSVLGLVLAPQIIAVFRNDPEVIAFGARALRLQCLAFPLCGVIVISSMLTQTINKVWQASVLAVARQGLFFIPAVLALPHIWGELGVQLAQPVSDVCAFALTVPLVLGVLRDMDRQQRLEKIR